MNQVGIELLGQLKRLGINNEKSCLHQLFRFFVVPVFVFFFVIDDGVMLVFYVFDGSRCGVGG